MKCLESLLRAVCGNKGVVRVWNNWSVKLWGYASFDGITNVDHVHKIWLSVTC